jgi:hypothetical protein
MSNVLYKIYCSEEGLQVLVDALFDKMVLSLGLEEILPTEDPEPFTWGVYDYCEYNKPISFCGKPVEYWLTLEEHAKKMYYEELIKTIVELKSEIGKLKAEKESKNVDVACTE